LFRDDRLEQDSHSHGSNRCAKGERPPLGFPHDLRQTTALAASLAHDRHDDTQALDD
jgi:hypothetical protein